METPSLVDLCNFYQLKKAEKAAQAAALKETEDIIEGIEQIMLDTFTDGVTAHKITLPDGTSMTLAKKVVSQFRIEPSKSDEFFAWVKQHNRVDMLQRRIVQAAVEQATNDNGALPPGIFVYTAPELSVRTQRAAPKE
jgi:hypothetical protein